MFYLYFQSHVFRVLVCLIFFEIFKNYEDTVGEIVQCVIQVLVYKEKDLS